MKAISLDLAGMSVTIVYAQVYQMVTEYPSYVGKINRMKGWYSVFEDTESGRLALLALLAAAIMRPCFPDEPRLIRFFVIPDPANQVFRKMGLFI